MHWWKFEAVGLGWWGNISFSLKIISSLFLLFNTSTEDSLNQVMLPYGLWTSLLRILFIVHYDLFSMVLWFCLIFSDLNFLPEL